MNVAVLCGRLSSAPRSTELGSGDVVVRYEVTVPREGGPAESVPVSWTGTARQAAAAGAAALGAGAEVVVVGRVCRRWYRPAAGSSRSTTEVVADAVVPRTRAGTARKAVQRALTVLESGLGQ